jgi:hypothetical protein
MTTKKSGDEQTQQVQDGPDRVESDDNTSDEAIAPPDGRAEDPETGERVSSKDARAAQQTERDQAARQAAGKKR